ncbi:MAG TPA: membrane dipeptidase [Acidimicrobiales bacterium]|nr:membrane dipeptidase [Acidimicrobiales bacterium]
MSFADYDFGLDAAGEARARALHERSVVVDTLFQGPYGYRSFTGDVDKELQTSPYASNALAMWVVANELMLRRAVTGEFSEFETCWRQSGITAAGWEFASHDSGLMLHSMRLVTLALDNLPWLEKALKAVDIRRAKADGRHALYLQNQPHGLSRDLTLLEVAYDFGLRQQMLTYNDQDFVGSGCTAVDSGLTRFGRQVVRHLNELGVIVDTAHCGKQTTLDACAVSEAPVIASHTGAEALHRHARLKSDEELDALAGTGGVIAVCAVPFFLSADRPATVDALLDHVDHIVERVGPQHVALGTDWPLPLPKWVLSGLADAVADVGFRPEDDVRGEDNLVGFDDYRDMPNITRGLVARGYTDEEVEGILGENFLRVFEQVCG